MGTTPKRGRILIIFGREICYHIRLQNTKLQQIRLKNALKNPKIPKIGGYPYMGANRKNGPLYIIFCREIWYLLRTQNTKLQLIWRKNAIKTPKILKIGRYRYMGATRKSGPIFIIFCGDIRYPIRTQCTNFQRIRLKNALKNPKIPKIGGYCYMGAMSKRGPIYPIFELDLPADKRQPYPKFQHPISIPSEDSVITTDGRTDGHG